jgi:hypothetical protein
MLPIFRAEYPILAKAQKPGGVTVLSTVTSNDVPNKPTYAAGTVSGSIYATGTITLNDNTMTTQNIVVNGTTVAFGTNVTVGGSAAATTTNLLTYLQGSIDPNISLMTYSAQSATVILCTSKVAGAVGNTYTLSNGTSTTHVTMSGTTLGGGFLPGGLMVEEASAEAAPPEEIVEEASVDEPEGSPRSRRRR